MVHPAPPLPPVAGLMYECPVATDTFRHQIPGARGRGGHIPGLWLAHTDHPGLWLVTTGGHAGDTGEGADITPGVSDNESMDTRDESAETASWEKFDSNNF